MSQPSELTTPSPLGEGWGEGLFSVIPTKEESQYGLRLRYVQLYLEILIKGKSRMLMEQTGIAEPLTQEQKEHIQAMKQELRVLRKNIGQMGYQILRPILRYNIEDLKILG